MKCWISAATIMLSMAHTKPAWIFFSGVKFIPMRTRFGYSTLSNIGTVGEVKSAGGSFEVSGYLWDSFHLRLLGGCEGGLRTTVC